MSPTWTLWTTRNAVSARSSSSHRMREADVVHARRRRTPRGSARPGSPSSPIRAKTSRWTSPFSSHSRMCGRISASANARALSLDEPVLVGQREVDHDGGLGCGRGHRASAASGPASLLARPARRSTTRRPTTTRTDRDRSPPPNLTPGPRPLLRARAGATARATGCSTRTARPTSTSPTGSRSPPSAIAIRAVTAAIHAQVDRLIGADRRDRLHRADLRLADDARRPRSPTRSTR